MGCDLIRNLDISALRSFVAVADLGGMTRAAHKLNLTQSAVSMQVKRLETAFESPLVERVGRGIALTSEGQQLLSYSRQILRLNDEAWLRLTHQAFEGQVILGVPEDLVLPIVPSIMREFAGAFPRASVRLRSSVTRKLKKELAQGTVDIILTTEPYDTGTGECLHRAPLRWFAAKDSAVFTARPLPIAYERKCIFMPLVVRALDAAGIPWEMPYLADDWRDMTTFVSAGLAVQANMAHIKKPGWAEVPGTAGLPALPDFGVFLHVRDGAPDLALQMARFVRDEYDVMAPQFLKPAAG